MWPSCGASQTADGGRGGGGMTANFVGSTVTVAGRAPTTASNVTLPTASTNLIITGLLLTSGMQ